MYFHFSEMSLHQSLTILRGKKTHQTDNTYKQILQAALNRFCPACWPADNSPLETPVNSAA